MQEARKYVISIDEQLKIIKRGVVELIEEKELIERLGKKFPLRIKAGFDPTAPDLHLGHTVLINKMRQFQDLGHHVIFLVGDFTARIGDPSGQMKTRPPLNDSEIKKNVETYKEQVFKVLNTQKTEVRFNSEWFSRLGPEGLLKLAGRYTLARMLERDDFSQRLKSQQPLSIHELLYPLLQGWDSVVLKADVELGGTDQKFNLLVGRQFQREEGLKPQVVMTLPLLEGTDGVKKMSKSYHNYIGIQEPANEIYGKVMSITDSLMWRYFELVSDRNLDEIKLLKGEVESGRRHPKEVKSSLAREIVARFHSKKMADDVEAEFNRIFKEKGNPDQIEEIRLSKGDKKEGLVPLMTQVGLAKSNGEARRLILQGGVRMNQQKVADPHMTVDSQGEYLIQVGKRTFKKLVFK